MVSELQNVPWTRKHDRPGTAFVPAAPRVVYPVSLAELIDLCRTRAGTKLHAAGSHWGLSTAAVSDDTFIESHDPNDAFPAMSRTLRDVVPGCLSPDFLGWLNAQDVPQPDAVHHSAGHYPVHMEAGKRVYQAYAELDFGDDGDPASLASLLARQFHNRSYHGSWAFRTLGGAGGQTVWGALTTGTHGGDFNQGPIAEGVVAIHLVVDGGDHYWIERDYGDGAPPMTDDALLRTLYEPAGAPHSTFHVSRDTDLFEAVLINPGRFGVVYSFVYDAVRQYCLRQDRQTAIWQDIRDLITDPGSSLFNQSDPVGGDQKFLQIALCMTPHENSTKNLVAISRRWDWPVVLDATGQVTGRPQRRGELADPAHPIDPRTGALRFTNAGRVLPYNPDPTKPGNADSPGFLEQACTRADFMIGILEEVADEVRQLVEDNVVVVGGAAAAVVAVAGVGALLVLLAALAILLIVLLAVIAVVRAMSGPRLGGVLNLVSSSLLNRADPQEAAAGVFIWQMIAYKLFESQQGAQTYEAISYVVMDGHNYLDRSCNVDVRSVEVFFDADSENVKLYVDQLIRFEKIQEARGKVNGGYVSLRFTQQSRALVGPARWPRTCVVEVAGLVDVNGSVEMVDFAERLARDPNVNGILHWGQQHNGTATHTERWFGDSVAAPGGSLGRWRQQLANVTANGRLDGFSSAFTRQTGLEVVQPRAGAVRCRARSFRPGVPVTIAWAAADNPAGTTAELTVVGPNNAPVRSGPVPVAGSDELTPTRRGTYRVQLRVALDTAGRTRTDTASTTFRIA